MLRKFLRFVVGIVVLLAIFGLLKGNVGWLFWMMLAGSAVAAIGFVAMVLLEFIFFLTVKSTKCPGWQAPTEKGSGSVWVLWVFATTWTLHICYRAVTWRQFSRKILDHIEWGRSTYLPGTNPTWFTNPTQF
jgi:hypothetical protein